MSTYNQSYTDSEYFIQQIPLNKEISLDGGIGLGSLLAPKVKENSTSSCSEEMTIEYMLNIINGTEENNETTSASVLTKLDEDISVPLNKTDKKHNIKQSLKRTEKRILSKEKQEEFNKNLHPQLLKSAIKVLRLYFPMLYKRPNYYRKLAQNFFFVMSEYRTNKTISTDIYEKIDKIKHIYQKDTSNNYSVGNKSQGYIVTPLLKDIVRDIAINIEVEKQNFDVMSTDIECFTINPLKLKNLDEELIMTILHRIEGITENGDYFFYNKKDYRREGRSYSTFSGLKKPIKEITDTPYEIDISTAVQSLMLSILALSPKYKNYEAVTKAFPNVYTYTINKNHKRDLTMSYTGKGVKWVKELFTVPCYGGNSAITEFNQIANEKDINRSHCVFVNNYTREIREIRTALLMLIMKSDSKGYKEGSLFAVIPIKAMRYIFENTQKKAVQYQKENINFTKNELKKKSIFYLIEFYEGMCRRYAMTLLNKTSLNLFFDLKLQEVHDAIYVNKKLTVSHMLYLREKLFERGLYVEFVVKK